MIKFRLKALLADKNMTQKELSEITGIRPPTISAIATSSIREIPVGVLDKICATLNCAVGDLIVYSEEK